MKESRHDTMDTGLDAGMDTGMDTGTGTGFDPVRILGCGPEEAAAILQGRRVTPGEVESLAMSHYEWWRHQRDPRSYWLTTSQAARVLHQSPGAVRRMLDEGRLPFVEHSSGVRLMRRHEIVAMAESQETEEA